MKGLIATYHDLNTLKNKYKEYGFVKIKKVDYLLVSIAVIKTVFLFKKMIKKFTKND